MNEHLEIKENFINLNKHLAKNVQLVAVSKTHSTDKIKAVYDLGQRIFGENKVQELVEKENLLPKDIQWHLIGHLQTNKVKYIAPFVDTIQSVDSEKLIEEINKQALKNHRKINILLQIKIAEEESKSGLEISEAQDIFEKYLNGAFPNINLKGLMGIATFTDDQEQVRQEFLNLKKVYDEFNKKSPLETLSMGMSDDYPLAIECGANSIRVGSSIFGKRNYQN